MNSCRVLADEALVPDSLMKTATDQAGADTTEPPNQRIATQNCAQPEPGSGNVIKWGIVTNGDFVAHQ
jgi:hypothetical protein